MELFELINNWSVAIKVPLIKLCSAFIEIFSPPRVLEELTFIVLPVSSSDSPRAFTSAEDAMLIFPVPLRSASAFSFISPKNVEMVLLTLISLPALAVNPTPILFMKISSEKVIPSDASRITLASAPSITLESIIKLEVVSVEFAN